MFVNACYSSSIKSANVQRCEDLADINCRVNCTLYGQISKYMHKLCMLTLYMNDEAYNLKLIQIDRLFKKFFLPILFTQSLCQKSAKSRWGNIFFIFSFYWQFLTWSFNLPTWPWRLLMSANTSTIYAIMSCRID